VAGCEVLTLHACDTSVTHGLGLTDVGLDKSSVFLEQDSDRQEQDGYANEDHANYE